MPQLDVTVFSIAVGTLLVTFALCLVLVRLGIRRMLTARVARFYFSSRKFIMVFERLFVNAYVRRLTRSGVLASLLATAVRPAFCHQLCAAWSQVAVEQAETATDLVIYSMEVRLAAHEIALAAAQRAPTPISS